MDVCVHLHIDGRVQRVGFRNWMVGEATRRGLRGWVRNRRDGRVEALLIGAAAPVEAMIAACRRGPPAAVVGAVAAEPVQPIPESVGFVSLPTV